MLLPVEAVNLRRGLLEISSVISSHWQQRSDAPRALHVIDTLLFVYFSFRSRGFIMGILHRSSAGSPLALIFPPRVWQRKMATL